MKRREFITLLGGAAVASASWPFAARAQQAKVRALGFLGLVSPSSHAPRVVALRAGLRDLGWVEGRNIVIEFRWARATTSGSPRWPKNWLGLMSMCWSLTGRRVPWLPRTPRQLSQLSLRRLATWLPWALSQVSPGPEET